MYLILIYHFYYLRFPSLLSKKTRVISTSLRTNSCFLSANLPSNKILRFDMIGHIPRKEIKFHPNQIILDLADYDFVHG